MGYEGGASRDYAFELGRAARGCSLKEKDNSKGAMQISPRATVNEAIRCAVEIMALKPGLEEG
jgi:hypothetical protein